MKHNGKWFVLIRNEVNLGFAEGNNVGIRYAFDVLSPDYILLLNNDTVVDPGFLEELLRIADSDGLIGSVQSVLLRKNDFNTIDSLGQSVSRKGVMADTAFGQNASGIAVENCEIFGACAAAALFKSNVLKEAGVFDSDFFIIYEDVDLSWRVRLAGYKSYLAKRSIVYHARGISGARSLSPTEELTKRYFGSINMIVIFLRYYPTDAILDLGPRILGIGKNALLCSLRLGNVGDCIGAVAKAMSDRRRIQTNPRIRQIHMDWLGD
jgi:hypothetical protein